MTRSAYDDQGRAVEHGSHIYRASRYSFDITLTGCEPSIWGMARTRVRSTRQRQAYACAGVPPDDPRLRGSKEARRQSYEHGVSLTR